LVAEIEASGDRAEVESRKQVVHEMPPYRLFDLRWGLSGALRLRGHLVFLRGTALLDWRAIVRGKWSPLQLLAPAVRQAIAAPLSGGLLIRSVCIDFSGASQTMSNARFGDPDSGRVTEDGKRETFGCRR
jgi:hypothetical protein